MDIADGLDFVGGVGRVDDVGRRGIDGGAGVQLWWNVGALPTTARSGLFYHSARDGSLPCASTAPGEIYCKLQEPQFPLTALYTTVTLPENGPIVSAYIQDLKW
jgi:hypothetical protein